MSTFLESLTLNVVSILNHEIIFTWNNIKNRHIFHFVILFSFSFILARAMSENVLERLRREAKEKEVQRKVEAFRREQIEKKRAKHVWLIGAIYVEPLASRTPTTEDIIIFEQEKINRELEEELKTTLNFF